MKAVALFFLSIVTLVAASTTVSKPAAKAAAASGPTTETGEIKGAKYFIWKPAAWNRHLLLLAHGLRPESSPLEANIPANQLAYKTLVDEGWMVATTSFRSNAIAVSDDIKDVDDLLAFITDKFAAPDRILLEGESLGGLVGTLIAERPHDRYTGVVAVDASLQMLDPNESVSLSMKPKIPIIFLTNQTDLSPTRAYVTSKFMPAEESTHPVIFLVQRNGHVNLNQRERLVALRALNKWIDDGVHALPVPEKQDKYYNATVSPVPTPSRVVALKPHLSFQSKVTAVAALYGNINIDAQPADFDTIGLTQGFWFKIIVRGTTYRALYGRDFGSVKKGEWVAYPDAEGTFLVTRNNMNAAKTADLKVGDVVTVESYGPPADS